MRGWSKRALVLAAGVIAGAMWASTGTAESHNVNNYFGTARWTDTIVSMTVGDMDALTVSPTQALSDFSAAGQRWDNVPNAPTWGNFVSSGHTHSTTSIPNQFDACDLTHDDVWLFGFDFIAAFGDPIMGTVNCRPNGTTITDSMVVMDSITTNEYGKFWWWTDVAPPGNAENNLRWSAVGFLVHELGHVTGYVIGDDPQNPGHFPANGVICDNLPNVNSDHTMCPEPDIGHTNRYFVTLAPHDQHTFQNKYGVV